MSPQQGIRQTTLPLNPDAFYLFYNDKLPGFRMSLGVTTYVPGPFNMTTEGSSSENWQLYSQGGRFFIRNYDQRAIYQLGLDEASAQIPTMLRRSGALGQQWSIIPIDEGADKGKWRLTNGMLGNETMLAVGSAGTFPQMSSSTEGSAWEIRLNIGSERDDTPKNMDMMVNVLSMEIGRQH
ncbi:hypothetical protein P154DRAFT_119876 [Amniculicola lignicola CBS 123094]|uniref:Carbohydrate-binding module family 13 protein n=1 Tax=Amniculicola lignicola CBS 123094 TaxID=1392246 RepID=A0A6A5X3M0_9PLEO|nr:hypothetical protein P154DRAFT_119876 [Amniculicola lignicola CBS 123094]